MEAIIEFFGRLAEIPANTWITQVYLGLVNGSVLILLALGLTIIFGLMGIVNFAHGTFYMTGAYLGWLTLRLTGNFWIALIVAPILTGLLGAGIELTMLRRVYNKRESVYLGILITFGLSFLGPDVMRFFFGKTGLPYVTPALLDGTAFSIAATNFSRYRLFLIGSAFSLILLMWLLLKKTNLGLIIRAGISNSRMVEVLGIEIRNVWTATFGLGTALAALAGVLVGPIFAVQPTMGDMIIIQSFIVVIIGGLGSLIGAVISALIVGQVLTLFPLLPHLQQLADVVIYLLMAFVLLVRPRGLFGEEGVGE
ncbi:MAG: branched-chain amino acid ABC transporter permease [Nitrospirae bacterium]|nr:branched-chain amino acid ABC transporter permease [Nitrospirota bacterium]